MKRLRLLALVVLILLSSTPSFAVKLLKVSTATTVNIGPFVDSSIVRQTGLTVTNISCRVIKQSDTTSSSSTSFSGAASGSANDIVHVSNGIYNVELSSGNTDTVGRLTLDCTCTGTLGTTHDFEVVSANTYDVIPTGNISTNQGVWDVLTSAQTTAGSNGKLLVDSLAELKSRSLSVSYGTAQAGGNTSITLAATDAATDSINVGDVVVIKAGTGQYQYAFITAFVGSTQVATTFCPDGTAGAWIVNPDVTSEYVIYPPALVASYLSGQAPLQPVTAGRQLIVSAGGEADVRAVSGNVGGNVVGSVGSVTGAVGSVTGAVASVTGNVGGNVTGSVGSVVGAVGSVTGNVGGNVTGSVGSISGITFPTNFGVFSIDGAGKTVLTAAANTAIGVEVRDTPLEGTLTTRQLMRLIASALAGKSSGSGTGTVVFRDVNDTKPRITSSVSGGNRTAVTVDPN